MIAFVICALAVVATISLPICSAVKKSRIKNREKKESSETNDTDVLKSPPAPAPAAYSKRYGWAWLIVAILAAVIAYHFVAPVLRTHTPTAPQRTLQQRVITRNLKFVGGDGAIKRQCFIEVQKGGHIFYAIQDMPWRRDAIFRVVVSLRQKTTGNVVLEINGGRDGEKYYMVPSSSVFGNAVFYNKGEIGRPEYFNPDGGNQIVLSSQGGDMEIQYVSIVMIYWE